MAEAANPEAGAEGAGAGKKGKLKLLIIIFVLLLAVGGAGGYFYMKRAAAAAADEESAEAEEKPAGKKSKKKKAADEDEEESSKDKSSKLADHNDEDVKQVVELQPFIVNLADTEASRYLRLNLSVGIGGEEGGGEEKPAPLFVTRVRSAILAVLSTKTSQDIITPEGKAKLRKELLKAAQNASEEPHVEAIYITDFIIQM